VREFGVTPEVVGKLEEALGFSEVMKFFQSLGAKLGEHGFVQGDGDSGGFSGALSPARAKQQLNDLMADAEFVKSLTDRAHPGHQGNVEKRRRLYEAMHPKQ
jgi:hypothetical protein